MRRRFGVFIVLAVVPSMLAGCATNHPQKRPPVKAVHSHVQGNVMTLAVQKRPQATIPPEQNAFRQQVSGLLSTPYGEIQASTTERTRAPLVIKLVGQGTSRVVYDDRSKLQKQLLGWQVSGHYLLLNVGLPDPDAAVADFPGQAVVMDLQTDKLAATELIGEESQITTLFVTPTDLVQQWYYYFGSNASDQYATTLVSLNTGERVTMQSSSYFPLGTKLYPSGRMVDFAGKGGVYSVDIPSGAWTPSTSTSDRWYQVVLKPAVQTP